MGIASFVVLVIFFPLSPNISVIVSFPAGVCVVSFSESLGSFAVAILQR